MTVQQKQRILAEHKRRSENAENCSQTALAQWAKVEFKLHAAPSQTTISRLLKNAKTFNNLPICKSVSCKKLRSAAAPELEEALYKWICYHTNSGKQIDGPLTVHYAEKLQTEANKHRAADRQLALNFSDGWMSRFKTRYGLSFRKVHGEALSADDDAIAALLPGLRVIIMSYDPKDVWNADEFGLFFRQALGWTLSKKGRAPSGYKKDKTRITFLAACNATGTEKMPLMIIGNSCRPRPFGRKSGAELGFDYHYNSKAWMNKDLFFHGSSVSIITSEKPTAGVLFYLLTTALHMEKRMIFRLLTM